MRTTAAHEARRLQYLQTVLAPLPTVPCTRRTAHEHARIWAQREGAGGMIGAYDLIAVATALERGNDVGTFNQRSIGTVTGRASWSSRVA